MFCSKCGQQLADNAAFCTNCGTPVQQVQATETAQTNTQENPQQAQAPQPEPQQYNANQQTTNNTNATSTAAVDKIMDTPDHTGEFSQDDIKNGKLMAILCYLGILVLIPMFAEKDNKYVRFHVNQGFTLFLIGIAISIVSIIFAFIPVLGIIVRVLLYIAQVVLVILGIINAATDKAKELPIIGGIKLVN